MVTGQARGWCSLGRCFEDVWWWSTVGVDVSDLEYFAVEADTDVEDCDVEAVGAADD